MLEGWNLQANESQDIFANVRGSDIKSETISPTIPKTIEQVPWLVRVFMATVKVRI